MTDSTKRHLIGTREAAALLGTSEHSVRKAITRRGMPVAGTTRYGHHRLDPDAITAWAATHPLKPPSPQHAWLDTAAALETLGPATPDELAAYRGIHPGNIRKHLLILAAQGAAERGVNGEWSLLALHAAGAA